MSSLQESSQGLNAPNGFGWRGFLGWSALLFLVKGFFILFLADIFFYGEELEKGSVTKAIRDGIPVDFYRLSYHYYEGGGFFISIVKTAFFAVFGENILAHRLMGMLTCWAVFFGLWRLVRFHMGPKAAHLVAAFFLFGPSGFQRYSMLTLGIHFEAMIFGLPLLDEGLRLIRGRIWIPSKQRVFWVGLLAGFAVFFSLQNLLILGWVGIWVLATRWRWLFTSAGAILGIGTLLGLLPMVYMMLHVGTAAMFDVHGTQLAQVRSNADQLRALLQDLFVGVAPATLFARIFYPVFALLGISLALALGGARKRVASFVLGFVGLWICAWYFGPFLIDYHITFFAWLRWAPMTLACMALVSFGFSLAWQRGGRMQGFAKVSTGLIVAMGLFETCTLLAQSQWRTPSENFRNLRDWKGYNYRGHFRTLLPHLPDLEPATVRGLLQFDEEPIGMLHTDLAGTCILNSPVQRSVQEWMSWFAKVDPDGMEYFARGFGPVLVAPYAGKPDGLKLALGALDQQDPAWRKILAEAIGYYGTGWSLTPASIAAEIETVRRERDIDAFCVGVGARVFRLHVVSPYGDSMVMNPNAARAFLRSLPSELHVMLLQGFEQEIELWTLRN